MTMVRLGMTPQRRQFAYPRVLTQTKPHPELLKEFWEKLEQVEEVDETPEKESEIESSISSTSSWSSTKVHKNDTILWLACFRLKKRQKKMFPKLVKGKRQLKDHHYKLLISNETN